MNFFLVFVIPLLLLSYAVHPTLSANCELRERVHRAVRELPILDDHRHLPRAILKPAQKKRSVTGGMAVKRPSRQTLPQLAKNLESFLQKIIPNHSLVQDLLGYVTMTNPNGRNVYSTD